MAKVPVARVGDTGSHGGSIVSGSPTTNVDGLPIARVGDMYSCPKHGRNPIVSGVPGLGQQSPVAVIGSLTACGARLSTGSPTTTVGIPLKHGDVVEGILQFFFGPPDGVYVPGRGLPEEVVCGKLAEVRANKKVQEKLREILELSTKNGWEYCGWIVEDPPGSDNFDVANISTDKELLSCTPGGPPPNAVGEFHTHPNAGLAWPSDKDKIFVARQEQKVMFYLIFAGSGDEVMQNDEGEVFTCGSYTPFFPDGI